MNHVTAWRWDQSMSFLNGSACKVHTFWYALECCLLKANLFWSFVVVLPFLCWCFPFPLYSDISSVVIVSCNALFVYKYTHFLLSPRVFCVLCSYLPVTFWLFQNIYIYAFSRHFYPKQLSKTSSHFCYEGQAVSGFYLFIFSCFFWVLCYYRNFSTLHLCSLPHHASSCLLKQWLNMW